MPVNSKHPDYMFMEEEWEKCCAVVDGERAVKAAGALFLPVLGGQTSEMYNAYKERASFYAAGARTVEGLTGVVFRKDPEVVWPEADRDYLDTIGNDNSTLEAVMRSTFKGVLSLGRHGTLLDVNDSDAAATPYVVQYGAKSILNWRSERFGSELVLAMVVLLETDRRESEKDAFVLEDVPLIRVLRWNKPGTQIVFGDKEVMTVGSSEGVYSVEQWRKRAGVAQGEEWFIEEVRIPKIRGKTLPYIPFVFINPNDLSTDVRKPPILDVANVNLSHYRTSADLEHGRHYTALPTAWVAGFKLEKDAKLVIGSQTAWVSEDPNAKAGYLEFTGQGLGALERALEQKEAQMVTLGARMLESPKAAVESADTHKTRKIGEDSLLASIAGSVSEGFERLLKWAAAWRALPEKAIEDVEAELNKDYSTVAVDPAMLTGLMAALQSGTISYDTFIWNLQRGELIPEGRTAEQEMELIDKQKPMLPGGPGDNLDDPTDVTNPNYDPTKDPTKNPDLKQPPVPANQPPKK